MEARLRAATKVSFDVAESWAIGIETYSAFGQFGNFLPWDEQTHRLFAVVDASWPWFAQLRRGLRHRSGEVDREGDLRDLAAREAPEPSAQARR